MERGNLPWGAPAAGCAAVWRGLTGTLLVISDAHLGLTAAISRMFQGCSWQRCRVHFPRNLLSQVPTGDVLAFLHFPQEHWRNQRGRSLPQ